MKTISNQIDADNWHVYNVNTKKHIVIGSKENTLLSNNDVEFLKYLNKTDFNEKEKTNIWDLKFSILIKKHKKQYITVVLEKIILIISFILCMSFIIWTTFFPFTFENKIEIKFFTYYLVAISSISLHELYHYVFLVNRNVFVPEIGLRMRFLVPLFSMYVDSTGMIFLNIRKKAEIFLSGIIAHLNLFLIFFFLYIWLKFKILYDISTINLFLLLFNSLWIWNQDGKKIMKIYLNIEIQNFWIKLFDILYSIFLILLFFIIKR